MKSQGIWRVAALSSLSRFVQQICTVATGLRSGFPSLDFFFIEVKLTYHKSRHFRQSCLSHSHPAVIGTSGSVPSGVCVVVVISSEGSPRLVGCAAQSPISRIFSLCVSLFGMLITFFFLAITSHRSLEEPC